MLLPLLIGLGIFVVVILPLAFKGYEFYVHITQQNDPHSKSH